MNTCFLTSYFDNDFTYEFAMEFKKNSQINKTFVFIASSFNNFLKTDKYCNNILDLFRKINIIFDNVKIIDYRVNKEDAKAIILNSDVVWLAGGDTLMQMRYFNEYNLKAVLNNFKGIIIGMSAGSINMADKVVLARDEEENVTELSVYNGLGLVSINIEPHLDFDRKEHIVDIKEALKLAPIYGLYDNSFIVVRNNKIEIFGEYYIFE